MKVVYDINGDTIDGISAHLKLDKFSSNSVEEALFYGINSTINLDLQNKYSSYKRRTLLNLWAPCEYYCEPDKFGRNGLEQQTFFNEVYSVCRYTNVWLRDYYSEPKFKYVYHPFSSIDLILPEIKLYDVCYFGGLSGVDRHECIDQIKNLNYRFLSQGDHPHVTDYNVPFKTKLEIIAQCKMSICYNSIPLRSGQPEYIKAYPYWNKNEAFYYVDETNTVPQMKARMHEAAFCKTLNLIKKDKWNVVEDCYEPGVDFLYFEKNSDLTEMITDISKNYSKYSDMIESAYKKSLLYEQSGLFNIIQSGKEYVKPK